MENDEKIGMNRTGLDMAPMSKGPLVEFAQENAGRAAPATHGLEAIRRDYTLEADRVGSVPLPLSVKGMASTMMDKITGNNPEVLIDKMGERLAYERTGVRLYEAFLLKLEAAAAEGVEEPHVDIAEVRRIHDDERSHALLLAQCLLELGADPTAMTPCADVAGVAAQGHVQVLGDPRTTVAQALNSMLMIELGDNASWQLLAELAGEAGHTTMAERFSSALATEERHLATVQAWMRETMLEHAT